MSRLVWKDMLALGVPDLDDQHRHLFNLINTVLDAMDEGHGHEVSESILRDLNEYTAIHFQGEERMMQRIGYPDLADHHREHQSLTASVKSHLDKLHSGDYSDVETRVFLKTWLVEHILGWDFKIVDFIESNKKSQGGFGAQANQEFTIGNEFYAKLLDNMYDGVYFVDCNRTVTYWNKSAERISGYSRQDVIGKSCADNVLRHVDENGRELCLGGCPLAATMEDGVGREAEIYMHHKQGHRVPVFVRGTPIMDEAGKIVGAVEIFSPNDKHLQTQKMIRHLEQEALQDKLTGLGNRKYADMNLDNHLRAHRRQDVPFGLLFIDIDFFKKVNDTYGHNVGDDVLRMVSQTIANGLRPLDVACRWGGEEFIALLPNVDNQAMLTVAERLRMLVEHSWLDHGDDTIRVTISLGGALSKPDDTAEDIVARADKQVYRSKAEGRNRVSLHGDAEAEEQARDA